QIRTGDTGMPVILGGAARAHPRGGARAGPAPARPSGLPPAPAAGGSRRAPPAARPPPPPPPLPARRVPPSRGATPAPHVPRLLQATDAREDYPFSVYFSVKLLGTALGLGAIAAMALGLGYRGATLSLILAVAVAKSFEAVSELVFGLLQRAEDMRRIAVSMLAKGTVSVLAVGVVLKLTGSLVLATLAMAVCWGSVLAVYDLPAAVRLT